MKDAVDAQVFAATPDASSWVSANAGSGKTRVLTDRVARLLLSGTEPQRILCLTYTNAAAAEMQTRLFRTLGKWAMLPDAELRASLQALGEPGETIPPLQLARARTLFARALETPGGLKIQTIHAFCEALLRRFPLEAGVAPQFEILDDRQARALRDAVLDELAEHEPDVFAGLARHLSGDDLDALLQELSRHREAFANVFDNDAMAAALAVTPDQTVEAMHRLLLTSESVKMLHRIVAIAQQSGPRDAGVARNLAETLANSDPEARLLGLEAALLNGEPTFNAKIATFPAKNLRAAHPELSAELDDFMRAVQDVRAQRLGVAALEKTRLLHTFASAYLTAYDARKRALGRLDFDDLIARVQFLLHRPETAAWVLWRLDGGLDHILVDEAQDTSPSQWRVIEALSQEFFAGSGARNVLRTVFVVGDAKQSIYSFQGADPRAFGDMRAYFQRLLNHLEHGLRECDLLYSFRSAPPILRLVDAVFDGPAGEGLAPEITHYAIDTTRPGRVELWPFLPKPEKPEEQPWHTPLDMVGPDDPIAVLAEQIAARLRRWLDTAQVLPGVTPPRAIRAGDVLILVQRRGPIFHAIIRALKAARVPVAGSDVLRVGGELAVKDLLAALRFAATPGDDLSLAALLRSPLGGLSESDLFALAHKRRGRLWDALNAQPLERWRDIREMLASLRGSADYLRPFELLSRVLIRYGGRRTLTARLGPEAEDGIDALLDQALEYERIEAPSVTGFLAWIDCTELTVKRRIEETANQVRVMTVHGAKGLEAPIVILPDTAHHQESKNPPSVLRLPDGRPVWRVRSKEAPPALAEAETARRTLVRAENRRLLYVALTRARSWLIVCGAGSEQHADESWHGLTASALRALGAEAAPDAEGSVLTLSHNWSDGSAAVEAVPDQVMSLPAWTRTPVPLPTRVLPPLSPSMLGGAHALEEESADPILESAAKARGEAIHRLLEVLPAVEARRWPEIALQLLPEALDLAELVAEVTGVLTAPELAEVLAPDALTEVDVSAAIPALRDARILGRIDRLIVSNGRVLAVDFKSNRLVPNSPRTVPEGILRQMGAYAAALAQLWPDHQIETAVLWTRTARLMLLPREITAAALARGVAS